MKKHFLAVTCIAAFLSFTAFTAKADISEKILQSFNATFAHASNINWVEFPDYCYVSFNQNDVMVRAKFDLKGNIISTIRYYDEHHLPMNILMALKKSYRPSSIYIVQEVSNQNGLAYIIQLNHNKHWTIVKSDERGNFELMDKFKDAEFEGISNN